MYTFEIHTYCPEQNKVFKNGINISKIFSYTVLSSLCKDFEYNLKVIRKALKPYNGLRTYKLIATRPNGNIETRFCSVYSIKEAHEQFKKAKAYYNIEGTKLEFKRLFKS